LSFVHAKARWYSLKPIFLTTKHFVLGRPKCFVRGPLCSLHAGHRFTNALQNLFSFVLFGPDLGCRLFGELLGLGGSGNGPGTRGAPTVGGALRRSTTTNWVTWSRLSATNFAIQTGDGSFYCRDIPPDFFQPALVLFELLVKVSTMLR
jgi:hypothetical protein